MASSSSSQRWTSLSKALSVRNASAAPRHLSSTSRLAVPHSADESFTATSSATSSFASARLNQRQEGERRLQEASQVSRATRTDSHRGGVLSTALAGRQGLYNRSNQGGGTSRDPGAVKTQSAVTENDKRAPKATVGQYYDPSSLGPPTEQRRQRTQPLLGPSAPIARMLDPLYRNALRPARPSLRDDSYKNGALLSTYISQMGRILPRSQTNLTRRSQREIGKAIRRARNMGILPNLSRGSLKGGLAGWSSLKSFS